MSPSREEIRNALDVLSNVDQDTFADDNDERLQVINQVRDLSQRLEKPREVLTRNIWMQPAMSTAIKIGQDIELFDKLPQQGPGLTLDELAELTKATSELLQRILRLLIITQFVSYNGDHDTYRGTPLAEAFTQPGFVGGMTHLFFQIWPCLGGIPSFLRNNGYKSPDDVAHGPWQHGLDTDESFFDWLANRPVQGHGFHNLMASAHVQATTTTSAWTADYPASRLYEDPPKDLSKTPLVVDIGGGLGGDMRYLRDVLPNRKFRLQVQDRESVVQQARELHPDVGLEFVVYDFFEPQPVKGAKAYFLHSILHDWPDPLAIKILENVRSAMTTGYSKLLLCERVVPRDGCTSIVASMDLIMLGLLCSKERTEDDWSRLLYSAGFRLEKIWSSSDATKASVIEAIPIANKT